MTKESYNANFKTLTKEIEAATKRWKYILSCTWIGRVNVVKITILLKSTYRVNIIYIKVPTQILKKNEKHNHKIHIETHKRSKMNIYFYLSVKAKK